MNYSAKEYGAVGDGKIFDTDAIQKAIDTCNSEGGGKVIIEPGSYLIKTLYIRSNVELHLSAGAILQGSTDPDDYDDFKAPGFIHENSAEGNSKCLIAASGVKNIAITGSGEINGTGPSFYNQDIPDGLRYSKPETARPRMLMFYDCKNVKLEDVSFIDSPCWTMWLIACEQVNIHRIKIVGNQRMVNNDGIDIDSCRNVTISDCFFRTGDDCLVLRAIQDVLERPAVCENISITNCVLDSFCQGIRIGCPGDNIIRNCTFSNIVINGSGAGINIDNPKCYLPEKNNGSMDLHNIMFSNFTVTSGRCPIRIFVEEGIKLKNLSQITFSDFRIKSKLPCIIHGNKDTIIKDISFNNMNMETDGDDAIICHYCQRIKMNNVELSVRDSPNTA